MLTFRLVDCVADTSHEASALFLRWTLNAAVLTGIVFTPLWAASTPDPSAVLPVPPAIDAAPVAPAPAGDRILGVIPNYQTVNDSTVPVAPLTPRQKWGLAVRETLDPFNIANAAF